jgi:alpha-galactosidase
MPSCQPLSSSFIGSWKFETRSKDAGDVVARESTWSDPVTGLRVAAETRTFRRYGAVDWVLRIENAGGGDSPPIEDVRAADIGLRTGSSKRPVTLRRINGDACNEASFLPAEAGLDVGKSIRLAPAGGRPSNGTFPFFDIEYGTEGASIAVGWTGQWAATIERTPGGPTRVSAGMEKIRIVLHPGERIRTPRILLLSWKGDPVLARNRLRRLILFHFAPRIGGGPALLPIVNQCFDRYSWSKKGWATEAGQIDAARFAASIGCDAHWLDAAWFPGGFPNGVGNWSAKPAEFPRGLRPVAEECHRAGLRFVLWFEPERVAPGTAIAREHPEFVLGGAKGGLFNLADPAARRWLTDLLLARIEEYGIDIYRNDFNLDPLPYWQGADPPDRQGMTEIRYVEGLYAMWDELRERRPGLLIDNCASGGRRIDIEMLSRSVPFWRSDTSCSPGHADWDQAQALGLGSHIPLQMACGWSPEAYMFRSSATAGAISQFAYLDPGFSADEARKAVAEARENRKFWYGDFYPLTPCSTSPEAWTAYQLHRPDLGSGLVLAFRRARSVYTGVGVSLRGIAADRDYRVEFIDERRVRTEKVIPGRTLAAESELRIPGKGESLAMRYALSDR